ncbi:MAG TPA: D-alanyl-D-alanine carboxypeptidase family protein [Steroidobacteraceae bacterium]|jgi:D-alanyl-D-alanine carboxypeptidase (penicillin-binding protein 5/6)|nr:D-alanyl-D-alanine carboxypeptidase family protein [Steroidobacteraceae bacterium]
MKPRALLLALTLSALQALSSSALALAASHKHKATAPAPAAATPTAAPTPAGAPGSANIPSAPDVDALSYILTDYASGKVLAERDADKRVEPASLTKLMTCYAVFHALKAGTLKLNEMVTISEHAWRAEGSRTFVQVGSQVPAETLIKGMIVQSGNDATIALAERVGGTEPAFVQLMNEYARRLGMTNTHFDDSSGLPSPTHYSTARDLSRLGSALVREYPEYYAWFSIREFIWNNIKQDNRNGLLERDPSVDGMKTGHTDSAGYCLVSSANRQNMRLIAVVMGSHSIKAREDASAALINYGFTFYETVNVKQRGTVVLKPRVFKAAEGFIPVGPASDINLVIPRGQAGTIQTSASVRHPLVAPLSTTTAVGELQVTVDGKPVASVPLYPTVDVPTGGIWSRLSDTVLLWFQK